MSAADWSWRILLRAYPPRFRAEYGREMELLFRDQRRDDAGPRFWARLLWDVARSAPALRLEALRTRETGNHPTLGGTMKAMAIVAILIGVLEALNAGGEGLAGGMRNGDNLSLVAGIIGVTAGVLLVSAGVALLRRSPRAVKLARYWAVTCLVLFAFMAFVAQRISIAATALGIIVPIVLLLVLSVRRDQGNGTPTVA